ncbi:EamA family transporter [Chloroflexota bacterium]
MNTRRDVIIGRAFSIGAALSYGASSVLIKYGVAGLAPPLVGAAVALLSGTLLLATIGARHIDRTSLTQNRRAIVFLLLSGVMAGLGILSSFFALSLAPVVVVTPIQNIFPLFALLGAYLFLGHLERITRKLVLGSFLVVFGVILVTIGRVG